MQPIINPWIFYWAEVCETVKTASGVFAVFCVGLTILLIIGIYDEDDKHHMFKFIICSIVGIVFFALIYTFIPSEKTIYKMTVASYLTEDNVARGKEEIKELVDYIADKIEDAKSEGE